MPALYSFLVRFLFVLLGLWLAVPVQAAQLTAVTMTPGVVSIALDAVPPSVQISALAAPDRLVIDLPGSISVPLAVPGAGSVSTVRAAMFAPRVVRLVFELTMPLLFDTARADAGGLTLVLRRVLPNDFAAAVKYGRRPLAVQHIADFSLPSGMFAGKPDSVLSPRNPGVQPHIGKRPLVVIDAGHGGKDVGAISVNGGYEKDVTLAIAQATAKNLGRGGRIRVKLTRDDDRFIPLGGRVTIARIARADLFISIHADSAPNPEARGASIYTLSAVASDAVAARLAARENKADIIGGVDLGTEAPGVGDIMIDLSRRATGNVSVAFAEILQSELANRMEFRGEFHHFAGFYVLKAPDVPSVLLETGYVSNQDDASLLFSKSGRKRIASGIAQAIERHLLGD